MTRSVLLLAHTGRDAAAVAARTAVARLHGAGVEVGMLAEEAKDSGLVGVTACDDGPGSA
ncbi:MAG: NAD(+) kinase, partial [Frankiales bacterium]|nr:NAD(+) kinase [Frankiales bacterium]